MKITVVTVTFNNASGLKSTLESLAQCTAKPAEVLIIDGASSDDTEKVVFDYMSRLPIRYFSEPDKGIYDAMNKGKAKALGDYIHYLNAGDCVFGDPYKIESLILPVMFSSNGKTYLPRRSVHVLGTSYCHQGLIFRADHPDYNLRHTICADYDLVVKEFPRGIKDSDIPAPSAGVIYDRTGISTKRWLSRDIQIWRIMLAHKLYLKAFLFALIILAKTPLKMSYTRK